MDAEMVERIVECLRGCGIGESMAADEIAESTGYKLSDVYDALEYLERDKLVESPPTYGRGDPTYSLTPRGKRLVHIESIEPPGPEGDPESTCQYCGTGMASPARKRNHEPVCGKNPARNHEMKELTVKGQKAQDTRERNATEPRPSADRVCRFCKKEMEPKKVRRHERFCGANPDRDMPGRAPAHPEPEPVPEPAEYAETATATIEHEIPEVLEQLNADVPDVPDEVPDHSPANNADPPVVRLVPTEAMVLKGTPGMAAVLRLLSECQKAIADGADVHINASIKIMPGLDVSVYLDVPVRKEESDE